MEILSISPLPYYWIQLFFGTGGLKRFDVPAPAQHACHAAFWGLASPVKVIFGITEDIKSSQAFCFDFNNAMLALILSVSTQNDFASFCFVIVQSIFNNSLVQSSKCNSSLTFQSEPTDRCLNALKLQHAASKSPL